MYFYCILDSKNPIINFPFFFFITHSQPSSRGFPPVCKPNCTECTWPYFPLCVLAGEFEWLTEKQADRRALGAHTQAGDSSYHHSVTDVRQQVRQQDGQNRSIHGSVYLALPLHVAGQTPDLTKGESIENIFLLWWERRAKYDRRDIGKM